MLTFHDTTDYSILIQDELDISMSEIIEIEDVKTLRNTKEIQTSFRVKVKDQAHLIGVINMLYSMHRVILKIESIDNT